MLAAIALTLLAAPAWTEPNSRELAVFPFTPKLNTWLSSRQFGFSARALFPLHERVALIATGKAAYGRLDGDEARWLDEWNRFELPSPGPQFVAGALLGGAELTALTGKLLEVLPVGVVFDVAIGAVSTRQQLATGSFVDTGWRFTGQLGGGLRIGLSRWVTLRLEVHDLIFQEATWATHGCDRADLRAMDTALRAGQAPSTAQVSPGCQVSRFEGVDPATGRRRSDDVPMAYGLVVGSRSGLQHNVELYVGAGLTF